MRIHIKFDVQNLKDIPCRAIAYFYFQNGNKLKDYNNRYCTKDGSVSVGKDFTPSYEDSVYKDFTLFMPNDELHMSKGKHHLKFDVDLYVKSIDKHIATSSSYETFTHTKT